MPSNNIYYVGIDVETGRYVHVRTVIPGSVVVDTQLDPYSQNPVTNSTLYYVIGSKLTTPGGGSAGQALIKIGNNTYGWGDIPVVDSSIDASSSNPVENKAIYLALQGKASTDLATTTVSGLMSYTDKSKLDSLATVAVTGDYSDLIGTPTLSTVATTGSYEDLLDKPVIPPAYVLPQATSSVLGGVYVDESLDASSSNPVENRAVYAALQDKIAYPYSGTDGQVLVKTADGAEWDDLPDYLVDSSFDASSSNPVENRVVYAALQEKLTIPSGGTEGQAVVKTVGGYGWGTIPSVDSSLSLSSPNPVENSAVTYAINTKITMPAGGSVGQVLGKTADGVAWITVQGGGTIVIDPSLDASSSNPVENRAVYAALGTKVTLPEGGTNGQVLGKTSSGVAWITVQGGGTIVVDPSLDASSSNPVENRAIYSELQLKLTTPVGGTTGQAIVKTADGYGYASIPAAITVDASLDASSSNPVENRAVYSALGEKLTIPSGGTAGQAIVKTSNGYGYASIPPAITVDASLDASSSNPVENRAVTSAINTKITMPSGGSVGQVLTKTADGTQWASSGGGGGGTSITTLSITRPVYMDYLYPVLEASANQDFTSSITMGKTTVASYCKVFNGLTWENYVGSLNYSYDNMPLIIDMSYFSTLSEPYWVRWKWVVDDSSSVSTASDWESTQFPSAGDAEGQNIHNPVTGDIAGIQIDSSKAAQMVNNPVSGNVEGITIMTITQSQYDSLSVKDPTTIYLIVASDESSSVSVSV